MIYKVRLCILFCLKLIATPNRVVFLCLKLNDMKLETTNPNYFTYATEELEAPVKLTTSGRGKLTTFFAGEDLGVQVC